MTSHAETDDLESGPWVGRPLPRFEDLRLVQGAGRYSDDITAPDQACAVFLRSPHAHAILRAIDCETARGMPGVLAILTAKDYVADGCGPIPVTPVPAGALDVDDPAFKPTSQRSIFKSAQWPLAKERVLYPGEPVAMVVAVSAHAARDAAEAILEFAEKNHADQIMMGARGSSQMRRFLGSVSSEVASRASCTVTLVRAANPGVSKQGAAEAAAVSGAA